MSKHIYSACAVGVGAVLTTPALEESWAASCLPIIGGHNVSEAQNIAWPNEADPVLRFGLARTEVTGRQTGFTPGAEEYTTSIRKTVTNLNILNRVKGSIDVLFIFKYTKGTAGTSKQRDPVDVSVVLLQPLSLAIQGVVLPPTLGLEQAILQNAGKDFKKFLGGGPESINQHRAGTKHHEHEHGKGGNGGHNHGVVFTALVEPAASFAYADPDFGLLNVANLGRVYFAEWWGEPYRQSITLLRIVLNNAQDFVTPQTAFSGQIVIDGEENGREFP